MTEKKTKRAVCVNGLMVPIDRWSTNPASHFDCCTAVWDELSDCWAARLEGAIASTEGAVIGVPPPTLLDYVPWMSRVADYLAGAGSAINPLPSEAAHFYTSDADAMASDWTETFSDMYTVCKAHDFLGSGHYGHLKDEQPVRRDGAPIRGGKLEGRRSKAIT